MEDSLAKSVRKIRDLELDLLETEILTKLTQGRRTRNELVEEIYQKLRGICQSGITILLCEQNVSQALEVSDRGYLLTNGVITLSGDADSLAKDEKLWQAYLGAGQVKF